MAEKILLVEDNKSVKAHLTELLEQQGHQVTTACNGLDGYNKALAEQFDLCIVDHLMPLMDGPQLLKNIKAMEKNAPRAVLFLSTQDPKLVKSLAEIKLADAYLPKPIEKEAFLSTMNDLLATEDWAAAG
ncbi:response regulator [Thalassotalea mangrovi]|uniref:Response regulator n=1 Tax=Thalassotalea mangrovi TaxID=2572245 RepID=A0A4U1B241_9GAMM|nr:response regulator [Thalassotalea mangrovi]TKB43538.1 response regulator [Thalassotalea mangrovi]